MNDKEKGVYHKFIIDRVDGESLPGKKHHECEYFVLDLTHDKHALPAIKAYAKSCAEEYPKLARDLINRISIDKILKDGKLR